MALPAVPRASPTPRPGRLRPDLPGAFRSDTGELNLEYGRGLFRYDTDRSPGAIGWLGRLGTVELAGLSIEATTEFAAITATSLDGEPIGRSRRVLLTAAARAENTGTAYLPPTEADRDEELPWQLPLGGREPVLAEPVRARVRLAFPVAGAVYPLDAAGARRDPIPADATRGEIAFDPADGRSIWFEIAPR